MYSSIRRGLRPFCVPALLILSVTLLALACGGDDAQEFAPDDESAAGETPTDGADGGGPVTFDVSMGDTLEPTVTNFFEANTFTVSPGQEVTFNITNEGIAIHNMRVDGGDGEYDTDDDTVSDPELFQAGDSGTLVWTASDEAGEIIFRCDFHPLDMVGTITVE